MAEKNISGESNYSLKRDGLKCELSVRVERALIQSAYQQRLRRIAKQYSEKGCRAGKVPLPRVEARFGVSVLKEIAGESADKSFQQAVDKESIRLASKPDFELGSVRKDQDLSYRATFECLPDFSLVAIPKGKLRRPVVKLEESDVDSLLEQAMQQHASWKEKKGSSEQGDQVTVSYAGTIDGVEFAGGSAENVEMIVGGEKMLPEFEQALFGVRPGKLKGVAVGFPNDYMQKDLAGKKAQFDIEVHAVKQPVIEKINKKFLEKIGSKAKNEKQFREELVEKNQVECRWLASQLSHHRVLGVLKGLYDFAVPEQMVAAEKAMLQKNTTGSDEDLECKAQDNIRLTLVLQQFAQEHAVEVTQAMLEDYLHSMAPDFVEPALFVNWYVQDKDRLAKVRVAVLEQEVVRQLMLQSEAVEDTLSLAKAKQEIETKE